MPLPTREEFINALSSSGLLEEDRLQEFVSSLPASEQDASRIADKLLQEGIITEWQQERLLEGKWRGFLLGRYKLLAPLGVGAMGSVFLAEHKVMKHKVAVKILAKRLVSRSANVARFEREARAAAVVNHPNVVKAFDIDREGDTHYLIMEFVTGENLQKLVAKNGPLDPRLAAEYCRQISLGLHEAHRNGLVHRDIKPANILIDETGLIKILDLGLARIQDDSASITIQNQTKTLGTVDYLAPEQALDSHNSDGRADIYSLGCTLYYLLTGLPPFPSGSLAERILKHQSRRPLDIRKRREGVPDALVEICSIMMEKKPEHRFQTAGEAAVALAEFLEGRFAGHAPATAAEEDNDPRTELLPEDTSGGRSAGGTSRSVGSSRSSPIFPGSSPANRGGPASKNITPPARAPEKTPPPSPPPKPAPVGDDFELSVVDDTPQTSAKAKDAVRAKAAPGAKSESQEQSVIQEQLAPMGSNPELSIFEAGGVNAESPSGSNVLSASPSGTQTSSDTLVGGQELTPLSDAALMPLDTLTATPLESSLAAPLGEVSPLDSAFSSPFDGPLATSAPLTASPTTPANTKPAGNENSTKQLAAFFHWNKEGGETNYPLWKLIAAGVVISLGLYLLGMGVMAIFPD